MMQLPVILKLLPVILKLLAQKSKQPRMMKTKKLTSLETHRNARYSRF